MFPYLALSYSQLHTYLSCPKRYEFCYVLKTPFTPHPRAQLGTIIHSILLKKVWSYYLQRTINIMSTNVMVRYLKTLKIKLWINVRR